MACEEELPSSRTADIVGGGYLDVDDGGGCAVGRFGHRQPLARRSPSVVAGLLFLPLGLIYPLAVGSGRVGCRSHPEQWRRLSTETQRCRNRASSNMALSAGH